ncbi:hypothetical protein EQO05_04195 [Methanosarcina sp. MSH10X1]|uniref:hypothetical protein n=1 Tax=Methanosarcina sp. MSH10X1 TaxID=2507075 RepID=UPI000FFC6840|nr:hypothetical protein [Methanosarcina sp. MSH10X1]RXA20919.1 hypothetical protein EQO05_04195 [Methanosarcina sp. MSH10X1]
MRDFTLQKYESLLQAIKSTDYAVSTVHGFLETAPKKCIILRHDVDRAVNRNLEMAKLEYRYGIRSTYYFRHVEETFKPEAILQIANMGHEIGFHYEVMDKANGNPEKAIEIFKRELEDLRLITRGVTEIRTACMHGNPLKPWSNRDLWKKYDFRDFGIEGEPYFSIDYSKVFYLTDTGRTWADLKIRVKDTIDRPEANSRSKANARQGVNAGIERTGSGSDSCSGSDLRDTALAAAGVKDIASTDDVIRLVESQKLPRICLLVHPNRWCEDPGGWAKELVFQNIKNVGKAGIVWYRSRTRKKDAMTAGL